MRRLVRPLFFYGTLRHEGLLASVLGRRIDARDIRPARAHGHRAVHFPGRLYPALVIASGAAAEGVLMRGLGARERAILDAYEGAEYRRGPIMVESEGASVPADAYWPAIPVPAEAAAWTFAGWLAEHAAAALAGERVLADSIRGDPGNRPPSAPRLRCGSPRPRT